MFFVEERFARPPPPPSGVRPLRTVFRFFRDTVEWPSWMIIVRFFYDSEVFDFWTVPEAPGRLLGGILGGSRGSGGVSGVSWEAIRRSWRPACGKTTFLSIFGSIFGPFWAPKRGPRWDQNGTKSGPKSKAKTMPKKDVSQDPLGAVLGRSSGILEAILESENTFSYWKSQYGSKTHIFHEDKLFKRHFRPNVGRFVRLRGSKREAKRDPRGTKNETKITSIVWSMFASIWDRFGRPWKLNPSSGAECAGPS